MKKVFAIIGLAAASVFIQSCFKNPVTGRSSINIVPESEVRTMATQQYASVLSSSNIVTGTPEAALVEKVGQRMRVAVAQYLQGIGKQELINGYQWEFRLINENTVNAWCMPGGKVAFYTGILPYCAGEKGIAVVMSHEIAHAVARHGNERMSQQMTAQGLGLTVSALLSEKPQVAQDIFNTSFGIGSQLGLLAFSRTQESEADEMGLIFMALAGYDPNEAIGFWQRMAASGGTKPPEWLSTHPSDQRRINDIKGRIPNAMKFYKPQ